MNRKKKFLSVGIFVTIVLIGFISFKAWNILQLIFLVDDLKDGIEISTRHRDEIVLVNIGSGDRLYLANLINELQKNNPKVMLGDFFLTKPKDRSKDSTLMMAIKSSKVILAVRQKGNYSFDLPFHKFKFVSYGIGVASSAGDLGLNLYFQPLFDLGSDSLNHISLEVATKYDPSLENKLKSKLVFNQFYDIPYKYKKENFTFYDYQDLNFRQNDIKDKIVILTYLGPSDEDKHITPFQLVGSTYVDSRDNLKKDLYGGVILANEIIGFLDDIDFRKRNKLEIQ